MKKIACMALAVLAGCSSRSLEIGDGESGLPPSVDMVGQWVDMVSSALDMSVPVVDLASSSCSWYLDGVIQNRGICFIEKNASGITAVTVGPVGGDDGFSVRVDFAAIGAVATPGLIKTTGTNGLIRFIGINYNEPPVRAGFCRASGTVQVYGNPMTIRVYANCESTGKSAFLRIIVR